MIKINSMHFIKLVSNCIADDDCSVCTFKEQCRKLTDKAYNEQDKKKTRLATCNECKTAYYIGTKNKHWVWKDCSYCRKHSKHIIHTNKKELLKK